MAKEADLGSSPKHVCKFGKLPGHPFANKDEMEKLFADTYLTSKEGTKVYAHRYLLHQVCPRLLALTQTPDAPVPCSEQALNFILTLTYNLCICEIKVPFEQLVELANFLADLDIPKALDTVVIELLGSCSSTQELKELWFRVVTDQKIPLSLFLKAYLTKCRFRFPVDSIAEDYVPIVLAQINEVLKTTTPKVAFELFTAISFTDDIRARAFVEQAKVKVTAETLKALVSTTYPERMTLKYNVYLRILIDLF